MAASIAGWRLEPGSITIAVELAAARLASSWQARSREIPPMPTRLAPPDIEAVEEPLGVAHRRDLEYAGELVGRWGFSWSQLVDEIARFQVAAPSWALGAGGTRFGSFPVAGEPRTTEEKIDDVAALHALTGANGAVSLHVPWDDPPHPSALAEYAAGLGLRFDAMNSNTFEDNPSTTGDGEISYKFGSMCHTDPRVRQLAVEHNKAVVELGVALGSKAITVWLADGTNHPGQASLRGQFERVAECLQELHDFMPADWELYTEHKPYEPAFHSTVNADWGSSLLLAQAAGPRAKCLVDLGHHLPGCNIEQVVSRLAMLGRLGGFHFNDSKYGDDDLTVGSIHPYQLFLVMLELVEQGDGHMPDLAYMIDESHNLKDPIEDLIQATDQIQVALAQALLVKRDELGEAQEANDPARAAEVLQRAYRTDVRPIVAEARRRNGAALSPLSTYRALGYRAAVARERGASGGATGL
jgi:L-rhamnose isomerase/sugar isomerase